MNFIRCYAPNNVSNEDDEGQIYKSLHSIVEKYPGKKLTVLIRNLSVSVGIDTTLDGDILGRRGHKRKTVIYLRTYSRSVKRLKVELYSIKNALTKLHGHHLITLQ